MRRRSRRVGIIVMLVLAFHDGAHGDANDLERELGFLEAEDLEKVPLSVVSRGPAIPAGQAPAVVDVITADEIRTSGARTLGELLEQRVGIDVSVSRVSPRGLNTSPSTAGIPLANNRTLLLVDGRPTNDVFFGQFFAGRELPLEHVARVEIIRGPGSALYGTNAMAGVVNVVTKDAADTPGIGAIGEYGSFSTRRADAFGGIGGPRRNASFFFRHFASGGTDDVNRNDDQRELFGFARSTLGPLTLHGEVLNFREELPGTIDNPTPEDRVRRERYSIGASLDRRLGDAFRIAGRAYANLYQSRFFVENDDPARKTYDEERLGQELSLTVAPRSWLSITLGGEVREEGGDVTPLGCVDSGGLQSFRCDFDRNVYAGFVEDQVRLPWRFTLTAGARYDDLSGFEGRFSPRANLLWVPLATTALKVGYGEAFRAPSFFELRGSQAFGNDLLGFPEQVVIGNPALEPEVVRTVEGEVSHQFARALNARAAIFHTRGSDLITQATRTDLAVLGICPPAGDPETPLCLDLDPLEPLPLTVDELRFVNSSTVRIFGTEAAVGGAVTLAAAGEIAYGANYTFQDTENRSFGDQPLPLAPEHKANLLLNYRPVRELSVFWHTRWVDTQRTGIGDARLGSYFGHDTNLVYRLSREIDLAVGLYNVLDDDEPEAGGVLREPRTVLGSVAYRFSPAPAVRALPSAGAEPEEIGRARGAIERARAAGAEQRGIISFREALAHLRIAEEMHRRGESGDRVTGAADRATQAAEVAEETAKAMETPLPAPTATPPAPRAR
ncbi:MAG: TonB-dependent receptor domain-containing protein, partial [Candidatus Binatia bacterium]